MSCLFCVLLRALGVPITDYSFEDCQLAMAEGQLRLPVDTCLLEYAKLVRRLGWVTQPFLCNTPIKENQERDKSLSQRQNTYQDHRDPGLFSGGGNFCIVVHFEKTGHVYVRGDSCAALVTATWKKRSGGSVISPHWSQSTSQLELRTLRNNNRSKH